MSRTHFLAQVDLGVFPKQLKFGRAALWDRWALDRRLNELSGLADDDPRIDYRTGGWGDEFASPLSG